MPLRTPDEYITSLQDGRTVFYQGQPVADVTTNHVLRVAIDHASDLYALSEERPDVAVRDGASAFYHPPSSPDDLRRRSELIELGTARGATLVPLIKEIGSDALFALQRLAPYLPTCQAIAIRDVTAHIRSNDLAVSVAQTDVKGDRSRGPSEQADPNAYLRIVDETSDGMVVRGAKVHTSCTPYTNELIVLPTRAMGPDDAAYAVSFAIPNATPGLTMIASPYGRAGKTAFDHPVSSRHQMIETVTIFDDVFVPNDRIFLRRQAEFAGPLALAFVDFHRFTAVSYKLPLVDALVGAAHRVVEVNGIRIGGHVRDKLVWLISYAETLRAMVEMSWRRAEVCPEWLAVPHQLTTNIAKSHFANGFHQALQHLQDLSGGLLVTGPSGADFTNEQTGDLLRSYLKGAAGVDGEARMRLMKLISDLTTGELGGYHTVLAIHAEGSLEAQKLQISRAYDPGPAMAYIDSLLES